MRARALCPRAIGWVLAAVIVAGPQAASTAEKKAKLRAETTGMRSAEAADERGRPLFTTEEQQRALALGLPEARFWGDDEAAFMRAVGHAEGAWLALSGGGQDGAFGAGVLKGWSAFGNRPNFDLVTGVSVGALMAPYVFLGSRFDDRLAEDTTSISSADIFEAGGSKEALFDTWPLRKLIEKRITPELLRDVAAQHARGRRLLVVTTSLDAGRAVVWNMGAIAARGDQPALKLFRDVLLASSSIPGLFPPVAIEAEADGKRIQELHADGTITAPIYVAPASLLAAGSHDKLPANELYLVANAKLSPEFALPERETAAVLGRAIEVAVRAALRSHIAQLRSAAGRQGTTLHIAAVHGDFDQVSAGTFNTAYMQALFAYGEERGRRGEGFDTHNSASAGWQAFLRKLVGPAIAR
jgi:predicted acylesterase/phospholipase RssA